MAADEVERRLGYPVIVKPNQEGSTVGLSLANGPAELEAAVATALAFGPEVVIERFVPGRELTVGVQRRHQHGRYECRAEQQEQNAERAQDYAEVHRAKPRVADDGAKDVCVLAKAQGRGAGKRARGRDAISERPAEHCSHARQARFSDATVSFAAPAPRRRLGAGVPAAAWYGCCSSIG